jgi:hypothetical protein
MSSRWSPAQILLGIFSVSVVLATILGLALGFDVLVTPPTIADTLDLPSRLIALQPFRVAQWPFDAVATLLFGFGFGALALAAGSIASLADRDRRADILRSSILLSGFLGVAAALLYLGGTQVTIALQYCDCGFKAEETISQFWALSILQGATDWLNYGAITFGAIGVALAAIVLGGRGLPPLWSWISWTSAGLLLLSIVLHEFSDTPAGDIVLAVASGVLLPAWALMLAARLGEADSPQSATDLPPV